MCKPLIIIRIHFFPRALSTVWKRSSRLPALLMGKPPGPLVANAWTGTLTAFRRFPQATDSFARRSGTS